MAAQKTSRTARVGLVALTSAVILAVVLLPLLATSVEAKGNHHRQHRYHSQQHDSHRGRGGTQDQMEIAAKNKGKTKKRDHHIGNPATTANPNHNSPDPIIQNEIIDPPTLEETDPGALPDGYNQLYRTRTFGAEGACRTRNVGAWCHLHDTSFSDLTAVQLEVIPDPLACGDGVHIGIWSLDPFGSYVEEYQGYVSRGESTGPITFHGDVDGYSVGVRGSSAPGCDAGSYGQVYSVSATINETTPRRNVVLQP